MKQANRTSPPLDSTPAITDAVRSHYIGAMGEIQNALDAMIMLSGGESGRDFTEGEKEVFDRLIDAKRALELAEVSGRPGYDERMEHINRMLAEAEEEA
jgi:hypothetical protein